MVDEFIYDGNNISHPCVEYYHKQPMDPNAYLCIPWKYEIAAQIYIIRFYLRMLVLRDSAY